MNGSMPRWVGGGSGFVERQIGVAGEFYGLSSASDVRTGGSASCGRSERIAAAMVGAYIGSVMPLRQSAGGNGWPKYCVTRAIRSPRSSTIEQIRQTAPPP